MKITYLHQYFNTPQMPGGTRSFEFARRLVAKGHEVNMVTSWRKEGDDRKGWFTTNEEGIKVHWLPLPYSNHMGYMDRIQAFFKFAWYSARQAAVIPSDVIFATSTPLTIALPAVYAARRQSVPMVFEVRDLWPDLPIAIGALNNSVLIWLAKRLEMFAYRNAHSIVALSQGMCDGIVSSGYPDERVYVIPNSSDLDRFFPDANAGKHFRKQHGIPQDSILITYAGTFGKINGVGYLIRLAQMFKEDPRVYFLTVGDGAEFTQVRALAEQVGCLGHNLQMLPQLPKMQITRVLAATNMAISTVIPLKELEANSANKFFDGLAAGCCMLINYGGWQAALLASSGARLQLSC
jgi:glycosyltransferase involved in cell wall biosynthesis